MEKEANKAFNRLFFQRELKPLFGKRNFNILILVLILFISFTVIGFAEGSLRYLEIKMKDPFINWVNVIPSAGSRVDLVLREINSENIRKDYLLVNAIGYNRHQLNFYDYKDIIQYYQRGIINHERILGFPARTLDAEDPIKAEIFSKKNLISGFSSDDPMDIGLTVTSEMLKRLNYPVNTKYVWMDFPAVRPGGFSEFRMAIPIPVNAVVKSLPGMAAFSATNYFFQQRFNETGNNPFNTVNDNRLVMAFHGSYEEAQELTTIIDGILREFENTGKLVPWQVWHESRYLPNGDNFYLLFAPFRTRNVPVDDVDKIFQLLFSQRSISQFRESFYQLYDYERNFTMPRETTQYDRISLNFSNLDKLREFSEMIRENYRIEVDMAQIESRENYFFVSRLTGIISIVLVAFSILSVLLFVAHLLKRHLEGIKRNLGTFKAFGLPNDLLINIYLKIVLFILAIAAIIALVFSAIFGYSGGMRLVLFLLDIQFEPGSYFSLISKYLLIAIVLLIACSVLALRFITKKILNHSPGDLIYERQ